MERESFEQFVSNLDSYKDFLKSKAPVAMDRGHSGQISMNPNLKPHARDIAAWMVKGGNRACFASYGLHKTSIQLQVAESLLDAEPPRAALIVCPLGVKREFILESSARKFKRTPVYIRTNDDFHALYEDGQRLFITNYERVREGDIDPRLFAVCSLDEAAVLRSYGSKTFQEFLPLFEGVPFKFVATATPSPNRLKELIHYAGFLGIMDTGQALTRFFKRDSSQAGNLTLHPHKVREFWLWVSTWAVFIQQPSDLGHDDTGYILPEVEMICHRIPADHSTAGADSWGQEKMFRSASAGLSAAAKEKRDSLEARIAETGKIVDEWRAEAAIEGANVSSQILIWCDLNNEQSAVERSLKARGVSYSSLFGSMDIDEREAKLEDWIQKRTDALVTKPIMYGSGVNLQQCSICIFTGLNYKANDFMQAIARLRRFGQKYPVRVHLIYTEAEDPVYFELMRKIREHNALHETMSGLIREYGLNSAKIGEEMQRSISSGREEERSKTEVALAARDVKAVELPGAGQIRSVTAPLWNCVNSDNVLETARMPDNSVDLIVTSWPFSDHYEYTELFNDFGHSDGDNGFFAQMEYLTPQIIRILQPGRFYCVHAKDRIVYGSVSGLGMYSVNPFSDKCVAHLQRHGLVFCGRITVTTDVVRENNQTYRLGYSENAKDGTKMGVGSPEYVLLFRKLPSDRSDSYADVPVMKNKPMCENPLCLCGASKFEHQPGKILNGCTEYEASGKLGEPVPFRQGGVIIPGTGYSRAHWQFDAHAFWRSSGNRFLRPEEIAEMPMDALRAAWLRYSRSKVYDFGEHVSIAEEMEKRGILPASFMCLEVANPGAEHVWDDVTRMRTLNSEQSRKNLEQHVCPLQVDIVERLIDRYSNPGELVLDPFGGIGTVAYEAVLKGRRGYSIELNSQYHRDAVAYCRAAESKVTMPTLFDMFDEPAAIGAAE